MEISGFCVFYIVLSFWGEWLWKTDIFIYLFIIIIIIFFFLFSKFAKKLTERTVVGLISNMWSVAVNYSLTTPPRAPYIPGSW